MNRQDRDAHFHLAGWILFLGCAFLFLYIAIREGDLVFVLASLVFLAGCIAFLIPLLFPGPERKKVTGRDGDDTQAENG